MYIHFKEIFKGKTTSCIIGHEKQNIKVIFISTFIYVGEEPVIKERKNNDIHEDGE